MDGWLVGFTKLKMNQKPHLKYFWYNQCDQITGFLKFSAANFLGKIDPNIC